MPVVLWNTGIFELTNALFAHISELLLVIFFLSKTKTFKTIMLHRDTTFWGKMILIVFFGAIAILGTGSGILVNGALANTRAIGIIAGGLIGGPAVGIGAGLVAAIHRLTLGGFTVFSSALSSVVEGVLAGYFAGRMAAKREKWRFGFAVSFGLETLHMVILLFFSQSIDEAIGFVQFVGIPIIILNSFGVVAVIAMLENIFHEQEKIEGVAAQLSLKIADQTLSFLRNGLDRKSAEQTVKIILEQVERVDAVAITSFDRALAFAGAGEDHHSPNYTANYGLQTESTKTALQTGRYQVVQRAEDIGCMRPDCPLRSKVVVPIKEYDEIIGALVLYRLVENGITAFEIELALGLARLISSQLETGKREREKNLLVQAELKALQAQINPHFLFNALNTITYYCRKQPETARALLAHLADFYRNSLAKDTSLVDLDTELKHVDSYVQIERARFQGKLEVTYNIPPDCRCMLPPLILQPIVENAIQHGIYSKREGGLVSISACKKDNIVYLTVEDDGVGMTEQEIKNALIPNAERKSIGLSNVDGRLKLLYPGKSGVEIDSRVGGGTKITIPIPAGKEQSECC
jgi:two-component system sensor histidine kinase LytS